MKITGPSELQPIGPELAAARGLMALDLASGSGGRCAVEPARTVVVAETGAMVRRRTKAPEIRLRSLECTVKLPE